MCYWLPSMSTNYKEVFLLPLSDLSYPAGFDSPVASQTNLFVVGCAISPVECVSPALGVSVEFEAPLSAVVDGEGGTVGTQVGAGVGAPHRDPGSSVVSVQGQGVLGRRPQKVASRLFVGENPAVASTLRKGGEQKILK